MQKLESKWGFFCVFFTKMFGLLAKRPYLCTRKRERAARHNNFFHVSTACLGYGVMVTLQILVLPFLVRVRVAQQRQKGFFGKRVPFFLCPGTSAGGTDARSPPTQAPFPTWRGGPPQRHAGIAPRRREPKNRFMRRNKPVLQYA